MKINGTDIRAYNAKQLTADVQPPSIMNNYEWLSGATLPTELETDVQMGHLKLSIYFKGKDRNSIIRSASEFMMNFTKPCRLELDGYDEKEMTVKEYENMALMKSVVEENTSGIVESVTQFQKDAVIDEYTQQLIEEGLI